MKIAILGYGVVGKGIDMTISDSNTGIEVAWILENNKSKHIKANMTDDYSKIINDDSVEVVLECIGGLEPAHTFVLQALQHGKDVVTSNKKMLAHFYSELIEAAKANNASIRCSASVGGGIPWLHNILYIKQADHITGFKGIMNGTSNYILDKIFSENISFQDALSQAQKAGYAEFDPSEDIDGIDTANKTALSANISFNGCFDPENMLIKGIRYFNSEDLQYCREHDLTCRLIGQASSYMGEISLAVFPQFLKPNDVLSHIKENYNCFVLNSTNLSATSFIGQGAGRFPTANNMVNDVISASKGIPFELQFDGATQNFDEYLTSRFYVRTTDLVSFEHVEKLMINDHSFLTAEMSVAEMRKIMGKNLDKEIFIAGI